MGLSCLFSEPFLRSVAGGKIRVNDASVDSFPTLPVRLLKLFLLSSTGG